MFKYKHLVIDFIKWLVISLPFSVALIFASVLVGVVVKLAVKAFLLGYNLWP